MKGPEIHYDTRKGELTSARGNYAFGCRECGAQTAKAKPYCINHVDRMAYVGRLLRWVAADRRKREGS